MAVVGGPDPIVQEGLVYAIDPANSKSYTSGSASAIDIIGSTSNSISSGIQVSNNAVTSWQFPDGTYNVIDCGDNNIVRPLTGEVTYNFWMYADGTDGYRAPLTCWKTSNTYWHFWIGMNPGTYELDFFWNGSGERFDTDVTPQTWHNICLTWDGTTLIGYNNGVAIGSATPGIIGSAEHVGYGADIGRVNYEFQGDLGPLYIYHKELSATEVLQNYNALKDRFQ